MGTLRRRVSAVCALLARAIRSSPTTRTRDGGDRRLTVRRSDRQTARVARPFPHGRFLAHSLLFTAVLIVGVYVAAFAANRVETATAFVIAHLSHLLADVPPRVLLGYPFGTEFLFWPFLSHPTFGFNERVFEAPTVLELIVTPFTNPFVFFALDVSLFGAGITLWYLHGCPGLQRVRSWIRRDRAVHPVE